MGVGGKSIDGSSIPGWSCVGLLLAAKIVCASASLVEHRRGPLNCSFQVTH